jgi:hypothetical protein
MPFVGYLNDRVNSYLPAPLRFDIRNSSEGVSSRSICAIR